MAVSYGFFDGGTEYGQDEFNQYFDAFLRSGVKVEDEVEEEAGAEAGDEAGNSKCYMGLEVTTDGKNNITVGTGTAILQGVWLWTEAREAMRVLWFVWTEGRRIWRLS